MNHLKDGLSFNQQYLSFKENTLIFTSHTFTPCSKNTRQRILLKYNFTLQCGGEREARSSIQRNVSNEMFMSISLLIFSHIKALISASQ